MAITRKPIRTRFLIATIVVFSAIVASMSAAVAHVADFDSKVSIGREGNRLAGVVSSSDKARCERGRDVAVFLVQDGKDSKVDDAFVSDGEWRLNLGNLSGDVYAKVTKRTFGGYSHEHICSADRSRTISI